MHTHTHIHKRPHIRVCVCHYGICVPQSWIKTLHKILRSTLITPGLVSSKVLEIFLENTKVHD